MTSVSIDRTSLSLAALTISDDPSATYVLLKDGLGRPGVVWRRTPMPNSADVHGTEYVAAAKEESSLPLKVMVQAATTVALEAAIDALDAALSQFTYTTTATVDGVARVWDCSPADWSAASGLIDHAYVSGHFDVLAVTIPVYPIAS